jgi:hypothetical protein
MRDRCRSPRETSEPVAERARLDDQRGRAQWELRHLEAAGVLAWIAELDAEIAAFDAWRRMGPGITGIRAIKAQLSTLGMRLQ